MIIITNSGRGQINENGVIYKHGYSYISKKICIDMVTGDIEGWERLLKLPQNASDVKVISIYNNNYVMFNKNHKVYYVVDYILYTNSSNSYDLILFKNKVLLFNITSKNSYCVFSEKNVDYAYNNNFIKDGKWYKIIISKDNNIIVDFNKNKHIIDDCLQDYEVKSVYSGNIDEIHKKFIKVGNNIYYKFQYLLDYYTFNQNLESYKMIYKCNNRIYILLIKDYIYVKFHENKMISKDYQIEHVYASQYIIKEVGNDFIECVDLWVKTVDEEIIKFTIYDDHIDYVITLDAEIMLNYGYILNVINSTISINNNIIIEEVTKIIGNTIKLYNDFTWTKNSRN